MMDFPTFPTDNLYKFLAISGLALLIFSLVFFSSKLIELEYQVADTEAAMKKVSIEIDTLNKEVEYFEKKSTITLEEMVVLQEKLRQLKLNDVDVDAQRSKVKISLWWVKRYEEASILGNSLGIALMLVGFGTWYWRVQRPQDHLLNSQMAESISHLKR